MRNGSMRERDAGLHRCCPPRLRVGRRWRRLGGGRRGSSTAPSSSNSISISVSSGSTGVVSSGGVFTSVVARAAPARRRALPTPVARSRTRCRAGSAASASSTSGGACSSIATASSSVRSAGNALGRNDVAARARSDLVEVEQAGKRRTVGTRDARVRQWLAVGVGLVQSVFRRTRDSCPLRTSGSTSSARTSSTRPECWVLPRSTIPPGRARFLAPPLVARRRSPLLLLGRARSRGPLLVARRRSPLLRDGHAARGTRRRATRRAGRRRPVR